VPGQHRLVQLLDLGLVVLVELAEVAAVSEDSVEEVLEGNGFVKIFLSKSIGDHILIKNYPPKSGPNCQK
jgi:hypothetical protein